MTYASQQDLIDRFTAAELVKLTDEINKPASAIDTLKVARALQDTDSLINSFLAARYVVPVSPVPSALNACACAIARYKLHRDRAPERVTQDYNDAVKWLGQVASGTAVLADVTAQPTQQASSGATVMTAGGGRMFTDDALRNL